MIGGVALLAKESVARKISIYLVSLAAGALLGAAFLELLPEAIEMAGDNIKSVLLLAVVGIGVLLFFEKALRWYHCHDQEVCDYHSFSTTVLVGDAVHNFLDGVAIALSFSISVPAGIATGLAVFLHEIPQEMGDFGVLLHSGYTKSKVLFYNFLTALTALMGAVIGYALLPVIGGAIPYLLAFAAGTFIYISTSDLIPELRRQLKGQWLLHFLIIAAGIAIIGILDIIAPE